MSRPSVSFDVRPRGSVAFAREDRTARFEVDVDDNASYLATASTAVESDPSFEGGRPSEVTIERHDTVSTVVDHYHRGSSSDGINHQYSTRQTLFETAPDEANDDDDLGRHTVRIQAVADLDRDERPTEYKGRLRRWPGALLLLIIVVVATTLIATGAHSTHEKSLTLKKAAQKRMAGRRSIGSGSYDEDADGLLNNPMTYDTQSKCKLPDYQSKNGRIVAVAKNGTEVAIGIKGTNWFGMETMDAIPFGLWQNDNNGTTVFDVAAFLSKHKFNSVRLPVCAQHLLKNTPPKAGLVNKMTNRALDLTSYMTTLQSLIQALAYRQITVLISMHTLLPQPLASGGLWYNADVTEDDFLDAIDVLTTGLCSDAYWNVIGIDLKNEPHKATWGTGTATDWVIGARKIGNHMLAGCPNWLAFVEGIYTEKHAVTLDDGSVINYADWWGSGLQQAGNQTVILSKANKLVWAPHYYNPGVYPMAYFYDNPKKFTELDDATLTKNIRAVMTDSFGYLVGDNAALVLGEFAGLYATDLHPLKTTKRATDATIDVMVADRYAGGYMWSLNPESAYQYNPGSVQGTFYEGLVGLDWLTPNDGFLQGMDALNRIANFRKFPCFT
ncbi:cell 5A endo-1,4-betaglucanase [Achlya hypogyna]|uniref:Cell 5A endo-1,4-betaglucanase n=1 Tax=Achlya hypogyna TaxID=1202772 RepID=A0A1V9YAW5_ACHHY|nr:cell 5A endo-1,4-betaglucanase [Achlya hypogyna]